MSENAAAAVQTETSLPPYVAENEGFLTDDTTVTLGTTATLPAYLVGSELFFTEDDYLRLTYALQVALAPILLLGIITNTLAILVYLRMPSSVTSTYFCLASGLDIFFLVTVVPTVFFNLALGKEASQNVFFIYYVTYVSDYVTTTLRKVIVCVTMMMSLDRYLVVAFPVRFRALQHLRRPRLYTLLVTVIVFMVDMNVAFKIKVVVASTLDAAGNQVNIVQLLPTVARKENTQLFLDLALTSNVLFQYTPLCLIALFNSLLVISLARHSRDMKRRFGGKESGNNRQMEIYSAPCKKKDDTEDAKSDARPAENPSKSTSRRHSHKTAEGSTNNTKSVTRTVLTYSILFTLLALPYTLYPLVQRLVPEFQIFKRWHYLVMALGIVFVLFDTISATMNFFVCLTTGSAFRAGLCKLLNVRRRKKHAVKNSHGSVKFIEDS